MFYIVAGSVGECSRKSGAAESRRYTPRLYSRSQLAPATASVFVAACTGDRRRFGRAPAYPSGQSDDSSDGQGELPAIAVAHVRDEFLC